MEKKVSDKQKLKWIKDIHSKMCGVGECAVCSIVFCPYGEPMHFHHDGCPACLIK